MVKTVCEDESAWVSLYGEILDTRDKVDSTSSPMLGAGTDLQTDGQTITRGELRKFVEGSRSVDLEVRFDIPRRGILERIGDKKKGTEDQEIDMNQWVSLYRTQHSCMSTTSSLHPSIQVLLYHPQYSCSPPTLAMIILSILQIAFYIHHSHSLWSLGWDSIPATKAPTCSLLIYNPERRGQIWRFLTYQFVHVGLEHVCFNVIMQLAVGVPLEMSQMGWKGTARVLTVYLSGVTLGSLGGTLPNPSLDLAGASAGVYALIAAHLATLVLNWKEDGEVYRGRKREDKKVATSLAPMVRWIRLLAVTLFTLFDVSYAIYNYYIGVRTATGSPGGVSCAGE